HAGEVGFRPVAAFAQLPQRLFRAGAGGAGTVEVNFFGGLGLVGQDGDLVVADFHEAARDRETLFLRPAPENEFAKVERRHEGGVVRQNGQLAFNTGGDEHIDPFFNAHDALNSDYFDSERHYGLVLGELAALFDSGVDIANHVESLLGQTVVQTVEDFGEPAD